MSKTWNATGPLIVYLAHIETDHPQMLHFTVVAHVYLNSVDFMLTFLGSANNGGAHKCCLLYTSPSPRDS